ncbi:MAG: SpoIIE family protein phosphatase [Bacteroidales bacterium]|nr:SpoIIE family protein phosphatase [Bacteroidales bacterium]MBR4271503.1 SpoIIE family protein phosphatase [Bacteroidales bacterium]
MTILDIILIVIAVALLVLVVVMKTNNKRLVMRAVHRMDTRYTELLEKSNSEVRRITALYDELRSRTSASQAAATSNVAQIIDIERLSAEQKKLEAEQEELSNRNRQLWDISVSIEKERQHIQILKNEIEGKHREVTSSIQYAKLIQDAVLPSLEILRESFQDGFLFWRPRDIVSGDFYWMKRIGDTVIFTVADCTGHGVPGAFMSMLGVAFLNEICVDFNPETHPAQILEQLRHKVITTLKQKDDGAVHKDGMDISLCIFNLATMKMQFSGANNGMYHVRGSVLTEYAPVRNPIGLYPKVRQFEDHDVDIQSGDYIYMFSDGYADQFSSKSQKFTLRRFRNLFVDINAKTKVAAEQAKILSDTFDQWRGSYKQMDDVLIGGYRIK